MTSDDFRRMALELPGALEKSHMGHPDFRVNGKIFATLQHPDKNWGMVKLPVEHQDDLVQTQPEAFVPVKGAWGRRGCTNVRLKTVDESSLQYALCLAWSNAGNPSSALRRKRSSRPV